MTNVHLCAIVALEIGRVEITDPADVAHGGRYSELFHILVAGRRREQSVEDFRQDIHSIVDRTGVFDRQYVDLTPLETELARHKYNIIKVRVTEDQARDHMRDVLKRFGLWYDS